jgi:hypothetical protein
MTPPPPPLPPANATAMGSAAISSVNAKIFELKIMARSLR